MGIFITVLIAIALLSFIIDPTTLQSAMSMFSSKNDVAQMNGQDITYMEYSKKLEYYTNLHQALAGTSSLDENGQETVNQGTWQSFLKNLVYMPAINKAGIQLGTDEMYDMTQGKDISPVLMQDALFLSDDGTFDRSKLASFVQNNLADKEGIAAQYWAYLQDNIETDRIFTKYAALLAKSGVATPVEIRRNMEENNQTADVRFALVPINFGVDSTITVSEKEIKDYYEAHKHLYTQKASRDLEYVVFPIEPSVNDLNLAEEDINKVFPEFAETSNLRQFLARNSDQPLDTYYYKQGELASLSAVLDSFAFAATTKDVLPVYQDGNFFRAARIADTKEMPDSVFVNHILIQRETPEQGHALADSLMGLLAKDPNRFTEFALQFSADQNPNMPVGQIGWFVQAAYVPGMESVFDAPLNKPYVIETQYGVHIVTVSERTRPLHKVQLAVLVKEAVAGKETYQTVYALANTLSTSAKDYAAFNEVASQNNWHTVPAMSVTEDAKTISGYENMREITRWAFDKKTKTGNVSPVFAVDNKYFFVVTLTGQHAEGVPTVAEMRAEIEAQLTVDKKMDNLYNQLKEQVAQYTTLDAWAEATGNTVTSQTGVAFATTQQTDPLFVGAVVNAPEQKLCGPVKGQIGVYVFQVEARNDGAYYTEADAKQHAFNNSSVQIQMVPTVLETAAEITDHRAKFF